MNRILMLIVLTGMVGTLLADTPRHPDELSFEAIHFEMAKAERDTLALGIPVYMFRDSSLPLLNVSIRFRMGKRYLPTESFSAMGLMGSVWRDGGTSKLSADELDERLVKKNIRISAWASGLSGGVSVNMVSEDLHEGLALWRDVLLQPGWQEDRLERAKAQRIKRFQDINNDPGRIVEKHFARLLSGSGHPANYLESQSGINAVEPKTLEELHARFVHPRNAIIGVSGDFDPEEILPLLDALLSDWQASEDFVLPEKQNWDPAPEPGVYLLPGDYAQSHIRMGRTVFDLDRDSPDYAAARIHNYAVGYGRVFFRTRQAGLSYGCGILLNVGNERSSLKTLGSTRPETTVELLQAVLEEVDPDGSKPLSDTEVETARNFLVGQVIQRNERPSSIVSQIMSDLINDRPEDHYESYFDHLLGAESKRVRRCGRDYNHMNDSLVVLVLGDPDKFSMPLDSLGLGPAQELEHIRFGE